MIRLCGILAVVMVACNDIPCPECPDCPSCPEPPECLTCPEDYTLEKSELNWTCVPDEPVNECNRLLVLDANGTPPPGDYTQDCRGSTGRLNTLCYQRQELVWQGARNAQFALDYCPDKLSEIGTTVEELSAFPPAGEALIREVDRFWVRLQTESEECPGRSVVNRNIYSDFQDRRVQHMREIGAFDVAAQRHPCRDTKVYDNVAGWCCRCFGRGNAECESWVVGGAK